MQKLKRKFAIVNVWPEIKNAETETIARIRRAATDIGIETIEINSEGYDLDTGNKITHEEVDFALHTHFSVPKSYDIFSIVVLWNPLQFFFDWGYRKHSNHLLSHDDFITCNAVATEDHVARLMVHYGSLHKMPKFFMIPTTSTFALQPPEKKKRKLCYVGINWEAISGKGRHEDLLMALERKNLVEIYGPKSLNGYHLWTRHKAYKGTIAFDGISLIKKISEVGAVLALSSKNHIISEMATNRVFEGVAAGALVIADQNPVVRKYFGDNILYIDTDKQNIIEQIISHLEWANTNPSIVQEMILRCQEILKQNFVLDKAINDIYSELPSRKKTLHFDPGMTSENLPVVKIIYIFHQFTEIERKLCIQSCKIQDYSNIILSFVIPEGHEDAEIFDKEVRTTFKKKYEIVKKKNLELIYKTNIGSAVHFSLRHSSFAQFDYFIIAKPNEELFSNHVSSLLRMRLRNKKENLFSVGAVVKEESNQTHHLYEENIYHNPNLDVFSRFMFSAAVLKDKRLDILLPYMNHKFLYALIGKNSICRSPYVTVKSNAVSIDPYDLHNEIILLADVYNVPAVHAYIGEKEMWHHIKSVIKRKIPVKLRPMVSKALHYIRKFV